MVSPEGNPVYNGKVQPRNCLSLDEIVRLKKQARYNRKHYCLEESNAKYSLLLSHANQGIQSVHQLFLERAEVYIRMERYEDSLTDLMHIREQIGLLDEERQDELLSMFNCLLSQIPPEKRQLNLTMASTPEDRIEASLEPPAEAEEAVPPRTGRERVPVILGQLALIAET